MIFAACGLFTSNNFSSFIDTFFEKLVFSLQNQVLPWLSSLIELNQILTNIK